MSVVTITVCLIVVTAYQSLIQNLDAYITYRIANSQIVAYLNDTNTPDTSSLLSRYQLDYEYIDSDNALIIFRTHYPAEAELLSAMDVNPLPPSYIISFEVSNIYFFSDIVNRLKALDEVMSVEYHLEEVEVLIVSLEWLEYAKYFLGIFVVFLCSVMISNAIRISYYKYVHEIAVLRILGANSLFIKAPYIIEALLIAALSILVAAIGLYVISDQVVTSTTLQGILGTFEVLTPTYQQIGSTLLILLLISLLTSIFTLRGSQ
ncbi:cell division protein FtsX [Desulfurispira natronophila]|uniref:Cell division protein FtsX n=1 Tax=Desulfurispira natronophila TaxID=682562 RepID=A0A7W8DG86_9BACT|nr:permease-like cell division protein FtsX [Desulfurispira natronophila]MBB5020958.1 cell division transport system permease protein [Desulfurispira natronophila]